MGITIHNRKDKKMVDTRDYEEGEINCDAIVEMIIERRDDAWASEQTEIDARGYAL